MLSQLEMEQAEQAAGLPGGLSKFLDIHLYVTSILPETDFKAVTLHLAMDLMHKRV